MSQQPYDSTLKSLFEGREGIMIPYFLPEAHYIEELNIEILRPPLRADRIYKVQYRDQEHVLHIEMEVSGSSDMDLRMLEYHCLLLRKFGKPVISLIIYPFKTGVVKSLYKEISGTEVILQFRFRTVALWKLDARLYKDQKAIGMYALLPAMHSVTADIILEAITEMETAYTDMQLSRQLTWLRVLLQRARMLSTQEKQRVQEKLQMFKNILLEDPEVKKLLVAAKRESRAEGKREGRAEGKREGRAQTQRRYIMMLVKSRFPQLEERVSQKISAISDAERLDELFGKINGAKDEAQVNQILESL